MAERSIVLADTATALGALVADSVLVCGSHGGRYPGCLAARARCRAALFNDAGVGKDQAGIAALALLDEWGAPAAAIDHATARIGDAADMLDRGIVSRVNRAAEALGCAVGQPAARCAALMTAAPPMAGGPTECAERRILIAEQGAVKAWALDSASQVQAADAGAIIVTGSHGGLVGGRRAAALKAEASAAVFNDAGVGVDRAGIARLAALADRGIAAVTVAAASARVGDGLSSYDDGILSYVNGPAAAAGARPGDSARSFVRQALDRLAARPRSKP